MRNVKRTIPEIFIPTRRPKPVPLRAAAPRASAAAVLAREERQFREIDQLMRSNTCPWL